MKRSYSYHSASNRKGQVRWLPLGILLGAILLVLAAAQQFYLHFTAWTVEEEGNNWHHLIFGVISLVAAILAAWFGYRLRTTPSGEPDRFVTINGKELAWDLTQSERMQKTSLDGLLDVERPNVRELKLTFSSQAAIILPIYLITDEAKQEELINLLHSICVAGT